MTVAAEPRPRPRSSVASDLRALLQPLVEQAAGRRMPTLVAATIPIDQVDSLALHATVDVDTEASLWSQPDLGFALLGVGSSWRLRSRGPERFAETGAAWSQLTADALIAGPGGIRGVGPLLIGGFGFSDDPSTSSVWQGFENADMVLPRLLVTSSALGSWLTASLVVSADDGEAELEASVQLWAELVSGASKSALTASSGTVLRIVATRPEAPDWRATVARFAGAVGRGRIDKVVLSRQVELLADTPIDTPVVLQHLSSSAPESTIFAVTRSQRTFLGATPERLISLKGREFDTVAMAGSTGRADDSDGDQRLALALLESDKDREEHAVVVDMLRRTLTPVADELQIEASPSVERFRHVQHLVTAVHGTLRERGDILALLARLHPTPAVGGAPRDLALELIEEEEPTERGWYAGPVGWVDANGDGEFVVALRSGVVDGARVTLFAGCGIVADSDPDREWAESLVKLRALGSALGTVEA